MSFLAYLSQLVLDVKLMVAELKQVEDWPGSHSEAIRYLLVGPYMFQSYLIHRLGLIHI